MTQMKIVAASVGAALALGCGASALAAVPLAAPGAVADALLYINNFTLFAGNSAAGKSMAALALGPAGSGAPITFLPGAVTHNADANGTFNGVGPGNASVSNDLKADLTVDPFAILSAQGGGFTPYTTLPVGSMNAANYAMSAASAYGLSLFPIPTPAVVNGVAKPADCAGTSVGECVGVHNQVNINSGGLQSGTAQGNNTLISKFTLAIGATSTFEMSFDATSFIRAALAQGGAGNSANASTSWTTSVVREDGTPFLLWNPDGFAGGLGGGCTVGFAGSSCTEYADSFLLTQPRAQQASAGDTQNFAATTLDATPLTSGFELELTLAPGTYTFTITHATFADAKVNAVPEPGTIALLALGLLGLGATARRKFGC